MTPNRIEVEAAASWPSLPLQSDQTTEGGGWQKGKLGGMPQLATPLDAKTSVKKHYQKK